MASTMVQAAVAAEEEEEEDGCRVENNLMSTRGWGVRSRADRAMGRRRGVDRAIRWGTWDRRGRRLMNLLGMMEGIMLKSTGELQDSTGSMSTSKFSGIDTGVVISQNP